MTYVSRGCVSRGWDAGRGLNLVLACLAMFAVAACGGTRKAQQVAEVTPPPPPVVAQAPAPEPGPEPARATAVGSGKVRGAPLGAVPGSRRDFIANIGDRVFFPTDQSALDNAARTTLQRQATWLRGYPGARILIEGHADERGTREYNLGLGARRANAIRNYLAALGIRAQRLETISYGKERPVALCSSENCWRQNRRGVVVVSVPGDR